MKTCSRKGCQKPHCARGLCRTHYTRVWRTGSVELTRRRKGTGTIRDGYVVIQEAGIAKSEHVAKVERLLRRTLPRKAQVHHVDCDRGNNANENLVVCPDAKYHRLLHIRTAAFLACGDANSRKCTYCGEWDAPENLYVHKNNKIIYHRACRRKPNGGRML